jgi:hypothetical protein
MLSVNKLTTALGIASNEQTFALANLNIDFSLFKVDAPPEFHPFGNCLSKSRRAEAEDGSLHKTARRLSALFDPLIESIPNLTKAYGQRVSQISEAAAAKAAHDLQNGIFSRLTGADGTSIWAAATAGGNALSVNLLACLLARMWPAPEATAVWVQIVATRKAEIKHKCCGTRATDFPMLVAAQNDITSAELRDWDASARAWLSVADSIKYQQHTQVRLILQNIDVPVNAIQDTYESVIQAWKLAMETAEAILGGQARTIQGGAALLGLWSWHLFPDLVVVGSSSKLVEQRDILIPPGALLTIGLARKIADDSQAGVSWS